MKRYEEHELLYRPPHVRDTINKARKYSSCNRTISNLVTRTTDFTRLCFERILEKVNWRRYTGEGDYFILCQIINMIANINMLGSLSIIVIIILNKASLSSNNMTG